MKNFSMYNVYERNVQCAACIFGNESEFIKACDQYQR